MSRKFKNFFIKKSLEFDFVIVLLPCKQLGPSTLEHKIRS